METVIFLVALAVVVIVGQHYGKKATAKRRSALTEAATGFMEDGELDPSDPTLTGRIDGYDVSFRLVTRGSGSSAQSWTECAVTTATDQLDIALRPQTRGEERWVEKGLARDLVIGDDAFDDQYIVEAAPAALAQRALDDPDLRAALLAHHPMEVHCKPDELLLESRGWLEEPEKIRAFASLGAQLAANMERAVAAAREQEQREAAQVGYRGADPTAQRDSELAAREQTAELKELRKRRQQAQSTRAIVIFVVVGVGMFALAYGQSCF